LTPALRVLALALLLAPAGALADMYKCVDGRGVTSYSDKPGPGCKQVDIHGSPPISGRLQDGARNPAQEEADFRRRQISRERADEAEKRAQDAQLQRCAALRSELARLSNGRRLVEKTTESGERVYMDDQAREQKIGQVNADLRGCP